MLGSQGPRTIGPMAKLLRTFQLPRSARPVARRRYPWDEWFDGRIRAFTRGIDFDGEPRAFASTARSAAHYRGIIVCSLVGNGTVVLYALRSTPA